jgi:hypothetical protein
MAEFGMRADGSCQCQLSVVSEIGKVTKASRLTSWPAGFPETSRDGLLTVSKASRLTSWPAGLPETSRDGLLTVSKASRLTSWPAGLPEQAGTACLQ